MPDRFLREGFLRSAAINDLDTEARDFYVRLLLLVDDFGCYDGRASVVATQAYPTRPYDEMPDVGVMLQALHLGALIVRYSNAGKPYLALTQWMWGIRGDRRFPAPPVNVDLPIDKKLRGHYGRPIGWRNPHGADPVSILLDTELRAVVPQPPEWRDLNDWSPVTEARKHYAPVTGAQSLQSAPKLCVVTGDQQIQEQQLLPEQAASLPPPLKEQQSLKTSDYKNPNPATTTTANGEFIDLQNGAWRGVTDAQCERWQSMLGEVSVPDQLERAAAWLDVHQEERDAIAADGKGFGAFIVRWLLREARGKRDASTGRASGGTDA